MTHSDDSSADYGQALLEDMMQRFVLPELQERTAEATDPGIIELFRFQVLSRTRVRLSFGSTTK